MVGCTSDEIEEKKREVLACDNSACFANILEELKDLEQQVRNITEQKSESLNDEILNLRNIYDTVTLKIEKVKRRIELTRKQAADSVSAIKSIIDFIPIRNELKQVLKGKQE